MNHKISFTGIIMVVSAIMGFLLSISGLFAIWYFLPSVNQAAAQTFDLGNSLLGATGQLLVVVDSTLTVTEDNITQLQTSLKDVAAVFDKTAPILQSGSKMVGEDFTKMVLTTRDALTALKGTAKTIDDTLRFISTIPLIGTPYNPSVPLDVSIGDLSQSMDQLPSHLAEIKGWLEQTGGDLSTIKVDTLSMADKMGAIFPMIMSAKKVTSQYQLLLKNLTQKLNDLESGLPRALLIGSICLTIFLVWLTLAQIGPFVQGLERFRQ